MAPDAGAGVLALWSAPRSRSTAFLRMMIERGDFEVLHEPFSSRTDFGATEVDGVAVHDERELIGAIQALSRRRPVFFKDTTDFRYPAVLADQEFLTGAVHTFLLRDPAETIASHHAMDPAVGRDAIGIERLAELFDAVLRLSGRTPVVLDSADLVRDPAAAVRAYCEAVGVPFKPEALRWSPGHHSSWRRTTGWHEQVAHTSGFSSGPKPAADRPDGLADPRLRGYLEHHRPFYQHLKAHALRIG